MKGRTIHPWTEEEEEIMRSKYGTITKRELAKILGRSWSSVDGKSKDMGLTKEIRYQKLKDSRREASIIRISSIGKNEHIPLMPGLLDHLMSMSGSMKSAVDYSNRPQNSSKKRLTDVRQSQIKRMLDSGMTGHEIVHEIGIPKSTVYRHIKEMRAA